jgi:hypothetical protein
MLLKVQHCENRYLTFKTNESYSESCSRNKNWIQDWLLSELDTEGYCLIESSQERGYFLVSPNIEGRQANVSRKKDDPNAKWKLIDVYNRYLGHPNLNYLRFFFLTSRLIPRQGSTGKRAEMKEHELGVAEVSTLDGAPIILWHHKGIYCAKPLNQMWSIE